MSLNSLLNWAISLCFSFFLLACQDHSSPTPGVPTPATPRFRLVKAETSPNPYGYSTYTYSYNAANKLDTMVEYSPNTKIVTVFNYNTKGQLATVNRLPAVDDREILLTYSYDEQGRLKTIAQALPGYPSPILYTVEYDDVGQLVKVATYNYYREEMMFAYTNGNVTNLDYRFQPMRTLGKLSTYTYDDKPNPYYGFPLTFGLATDRAPTEGLPFFPSSRPYIHELSKNNSVNPNLIYEYNSYNMLIRTTNPKGHQISVINTYEQY